MLVGGFEGPEDGERHVNSQHFKTIMAWLPEVIAGTPEIINVEAPGVTGRGATAELVPRR